MAMVKCRGCFEKEGTKVPEHDTLEGYCMLCAARIIRKSEKQAKRLKELEEALKKYGRCLEICSFTQGLKGNSLEQCDCGFEQALKGEK